MQAINPSQTGIRSNRILSMFLDHALMTIVMLVILSPWMIGFSNRIEEADPTQPFFYLPTWAILLWSVGGSLYLNKDARRGQSFAKLMFGFRVIGKDGQTNIHPVRLLIRNLTAVIWPVEIVLNLRDPSRRIGDYLAGTQLVLSDASEEYPMAKTRCIIVSLILGFLLTFGITYAGSQLMKQTLTPDFVRANFNKEMSDKLGAQLKSTHPDIIMEASFDVFDSSRIGTGGYIQGMIGVAPDSLLENGFSGLESKVLENLIGATTLGDYQAAIRYYPAADPKVEGRVKRYVLPAGDLSTQEEFSGKWISDGYAIPEDVITPGPLSIISFARQIDSAEHLMIDETEISGLISVYSDSSFISSTWAYHFNLADSAFFLWSHTRENGVGKLIMWDQSEMYLRSDDGVLLKLKRE